MYKPKKGRYAGYAGGDLHKDNIQNFIDDILSGGGDFKAVKGGPKAELKLSNKGYNQKSIGGGSQRKNEL